MIDRRNLLICLSAVSFIAPAAAQTQQKPLRPVSLRLDWKPGAQHAPFYLGKAKGFFADEGIDLNIIAGSGSSDVVKQIGTQSVEVGLVDALVLVQASEQKLPIRSVAAYYQRNPIVVISPADKPIDNPRQLVGGVKLGSKKGSATYQGLLALLSANNIKLEDVKLVDVGFGVQPLLVKQVDALMGFAMNEPVEAESAGLKVHQMPISAHGVTSYGLTLALNLNWLNKNHSLAAGFIRALQKSIKTATDDKKLAIDALIKSVPELDAARETKVLEQTIPYWTSSETQAHGPGWQTADVWQATAKMAKDVGLTDTVVDSASLFSNDLLQSVR